MTSTKAAPYRTSYTVKRLSKAGEHPGDMEGTTHAASGLAAGLAIGLAAPGPWQHRLGPALVQGLVVAGFALLPDADHPRATFAWTGSWITRGVAHLIAVLFGGHRQGMHSVPVTALLTGLAAWLVWLHPVRPAQYVAGAFTAVCVAGGLIATGFARQGFIPLAIGGAVAGYVVLKDPAALAWMLPLGMGIHIAEDCCTGYGCGLLWPITRRRFLGSKPRVVLSTKRARSRPGKARGGRPASRAPAPSRPAPARTAAWKPGPMWTEMCLDCLDGEHNCKDRCCRCTRCIKIRRPAPLPDPDPAGENPPF